MLQIIQIAIIVGCLGNGLAQRVPPGVPPQHYQQVPQQQQQQQYAQHQQYQQQQYAPQHGQQQQQHIPVQQQQHVPVQQQQFQQQQHVPVQQQQQVPVQQGHQGGHGHHGGQPQQILSAANLEHEKEHLAEHLHAPIDTSKMTEQELQFHYFKMHDADNNNKLDGCELIKSLIHWHGEDEKEERFFSDEQLIEQVDSMLNYLDINNDGFVDWVEYKRQMSHDQSHDNKD